MSIQQTSKKFILTIILSTVGTLLIFLSLTEKSFANHVILLVGIAMDITGGVSAGGVH